jgi:hypothetical protein
MSHLSKAPKRFSSLWGSFLLHCTYMYKIISSILLPVLLVPTISFGAWYQIEKTISVNADGQMGDNESRLARIALGGRYVVFQSFATNLIPGGTAPGVAHVYVYDMVLDTIDLVSKSFDDGQGNANSFAPYISADGRYVVFYSGASNLVPDDTNGVADVFVRDLQENITHRVSVASDGTQGNASSSQAGTYPNISVDGRYITFYSNASNLVSDDTNGVGDIFVHDLEEGTTRRVSVASDGTQGDAISFGSGISSSGNYVSFSSNASNLVPGDTNGVTDIFVHDLEEGTTRRVSVASDGTQGDAISGDIFAIPMFSPDERHVIFSSQASNLVPDDTNGIADIFVHDLVSGETQRVSLGFDGSEVFVSPSFFTHGFILDNADYVLFNVIAPDFTIVDGPTSDFREIVVRDMNRQKNHLLLLEDRTERPNQSLQYPSTTLDGRFMSLHSSATNLIEGDFNGFLQVFIARRLDPTLEYSGGFVETDANRGFVEGSLVVTFTNSDDVFSLGEGNFIFGNQYEIDNLPPGLTPVFTIDQQGTRGTLTFQGRATQHELSHSVDSLVLRFLDEAFSVVSAYAVDQSEDTGIAILFRDREVAISSGGTSVQSQVSNLQSMGKQEEANVIIETFPHLFASVSSATVQSLLFQVQQLQQQLLSLQKLEKGIAVYPRLQKGDRGSFVLQMQTLLETKGFSPQKLDGIFGILTDAAVRQFQTARGLTVDGIVGAKTWGALLQ